MAGRWRSVVVAGLLILALGGVAALVSRMRGGSAIEAEDAGPTSAVTTTAPTEATELPLVADGSTSAQAGVPGPPTTAPAGGAPFSSAAGGAGDSVASSASQPAAAGTPGTGPTTSRLAATATGPTAASTTAPAPAPADAPAGGTAPLAGRIKPGGTYSGVATFYGADGGGACLFDPPSSDRMVAAMNTRDYETSKACGVRVQVRAANGAAITVRIVDECPGDCQVGQIDLSQEAFARLADPTLGRIPITWSLVSPDTAGSLAIRYKDGSSQYWCGLQVIDHRNPVARLEVSVNGAYKVLERTSYNYFLSPDGAGCGSTIRVTDIYGESLTIPALPIQPGATQKTSVQFGRH